MRDDAERDVEEIEIIDVDAREIIFAEEKTRTPPTLWWSLTMLLASLLVLLLAVKAQALEILSKNPGISSNAHWRDYPTLRLGSLADFPAYNIHINNEPEYFGWTGSRYRLPADHPYYRYNFVPLPNGLYQFQFALDRTQGDSHQKIYFDINDSFQRRPVPIDSLTAVSLNLKGAWEPPAGEHAQRIVIGIGVRWAGRTNWVELNPYAHNFDWCGQVNEGNPNGLPAGVCDTQGIYDRRSFFGGEIVEYTVPGIGNYPRLIPRTGWTHYWIDWGPLIRDYPWQRPPADWSDAEIVGAYIGIESIGRTFAYLQVRNFVTLGMGD